MVFVIVFMYYIQSFYRSCMNVLLCNVVNTKQKESTLMHNSVGRVAQLAYLYSCRMSQILPMT